MGISTETASKLLQGEFRTLMKLAKYDEKYSEKDKSITILIRNQPDNKLKDGINIVETFFINCE